MELINSIICDFIVHYYNKQMYIFFYTNIKLAIIIKSTHQLIQLAALYVDVLI